jgi:hypothetical protein
LGDLRTAVGRIASGGTAVLQVGREGQLRFITLTLE